jgi:hypothetical protein
MHILELEEVGFMCTAPYMYTYGLWMMIHEPLSIYVILVQTRAYSNTMAKTKKILF